MSEHRWSVGIVVPLSEEQAQRLGALDMPERLAFVAQLEQEPTIIRGPLCLECGVQRRYLDVQPGKPWPCPGRRPESLGQAPAMPDPAGNRQAVRAQRRKAGKASSAVRPDPSSPELVKARVQAAMHAARGQRVERETIEQAVGEGWEAVAAALAASDADPSEFWDPLTPDKPGLHFATRR